MRVTRSADLTDDPRGSRRAIRRLQAGEQVIGMLRIGLGDSEWIYAETEAEGKTVWGFLPMDAAEELPPPWHLEDGKLIIDEGVTGLGEVQAPEYINDSIWNVSGWVTRVEPGDVYAPEIYLDQMELDLGQRIRTVILPESLKQIGGWSLSNSSLEELRLPGSLRSVAGEGIEVYVDRMVLSSGYVLDIPTDLRGRVRVWEVEEGNPVYKSADGVLFSADGKTLIQYGGEEQTHYDVPAGTEVIAGGAFDDGLMNVPLESISLPIGLKKIESRAFSGCGRLRSMTVPLTVTELAPDAFAGCVSLERLSLPPGMQATIGRGAEQADFTFFNGDNGSTYLEWHENTAGREPRDFSVFTAVLDNEAGTGPVPLYAGPEDPEQAGEGQAGEKCYVYEVKNGRALVSDRKEKPLWADTENLYYPMRDLFFDDWDFEAAKEAPRDYWEAWQGGETFGAVRKEDPAVSLRESPEGTEITHLYADTQARVLEKTDGWLRIETGYGEGWIPMDSLIPMVEAEEDWI